MNLSFVWPSEVDGLRYWCLHHWTIREPVTPRVYDRAIGWRVLGIEFVRYDTRTGRP